MRGANLEGETGWMGGRDVLRSLHICFLIIARYCELEEHAALFLGYE